MTLASIRVELPSNTPVVLLQEAGEGRRTLPILIGHQEATAIAFALQGVETQRPLTHDLMKDLLTSLGVEIEAIVVTEMVESIFYAEIRMVKPGGEKVTVSSRPSDAMALAVRTGTTIYAEESLLEAEGVVLHDDNDQEEIIEEFQRFIDDVRPEDFAS